MNGFNTSHAKYHNDIYNAMKKYKGQTLKTSEIKKICIQYGVPMDWIFPSDHCTNSENKGMCGLCLHNSDIRIFTKIKHGYYLVN